MCLYKAFRVAEVRPAKPGLTISRLVMPGVCWFALGSGTSIYPESYDNPIFYIVESGTGSFMLDGKDVPVFPGQLLLVQQGSLCGTDCFKDFIYTEVMIAKENISMNDLVKPGTPLMLKDLIDYEPDCISNIDIVSNDKMKFVLMAFNEGTGLTPHRAPGNAILTALEGKATIGYEGQDYTLEAGQSFRFAQNGLHSVTPQGKFKMSLLLVLE